MQIVYIAGAFRANTPYQIHLNIIHAEARALDLWKEKDADGQHKYAVICPHKNTEFFQNECDDDVWLDGCLEILKRCDAVYFLSGWEKSKGSIREYELATELEKEIYFETV